MTRPEDPENTATEFQGASVGRLMMFDDDHLRIGVVATGHEKALLEMHLRSHPEHDGPVPVRLGDELDRGPYRISVVTIRDGTVAVEVDKTAARESR